MINASGIEQTPYLENDEADEAIDPPLSLKKLMIVFINIIRCKLTYIILPPPMGTHL